MIELAGPSVAAPSSFHVISARSPVLGVRAIDSWVFALMVAGKIVVSAGWAQPVTFLEWFAHCRPSLRGALSSQAGCPQCRPLGSSGPFASSLRD